MGLLKKLNAEGMTIIMVTHSEESAKSARRILKIEDGHLVEEEQSVGDAATVKHIRSDLLVAPAAS